MSRTAGSQRVARFLDRLVRTVEPGSALPSFRDMMRQCQVGPSTISDVLRDFEQRNLVVVRPQKGIFRSGMPTQPDQQRNRLAQIDLIFETASRSAARTIHEELACDMLQLATRRGYNLSMHTIVRESDDFVRIADGGACEACVIMNLVDPARLDPLRRAHIPFVNLYPAGAELPPNCVITDPDQVIAAQIGHLLELGHRRIGYLHNIRESFHRDLVLRREAFYRLALEHNLPIRNEWVRYGGYNDEDRRAGIEAILHASSRPTALICADDHLNVVYAVLREHGLTIGEDVSVIGTNDDPVAAAAHPPATTVRIPRLRSVIASLDMLEQLMDSPTGIVDHQAVDARVIVRASTGPAPTEVSPQ